MTHVQPIDFGEILDVEDSGRYLPSGAAPICGLYERHDGVRYRLETRFGKLVQDVVRISDDALLFACESSLDGALFQQQIVGDRDWSHIQFRISGGGQENIAHSHIVATPEKSCVIARYQRNSIIERRIDDESRWKWACLFITPAALTGLLDTTVSALPEQAAWIGMEGHSQYRLLPLHSSMSLAVNEILACSYRGASRRAYMRGKALELLSSVIHTLDHGRTENIGQELKLSSTDIDRLIRARKIMSEGFDTPMTLATLAKRVGLNRTKLALGFKRTYGVSVQAYWRDEKLHRARQLLTEGGMSVMDVALMVGYSEISSFSRAFSRKFGVLPRDCKAKVH